MFVLGKCVGRHNKKLIVALGIFLLSITGLVGVIRINDSKPTPSTEEKDRNAARLLDREKYRDLPGCEGTANVQLGPHVLTIPREDGISLNRTINKPYFSTYNNLHRPSPIADCQKTYFDDVTAITMLGEHVPFPSGTFSIWYDSSSNSLDQYESAITILRKEEEEEEEGINLERGKLYDGVEYIKTGKYSGWYFLPKDIAPTKSGSPVVFSCSDSIFGYSCRTRYILPNGLHISYSLNNDFETFLSFDHQAREFVKNLMSREKPKTKQ